MFTWLVIIKWGYHKFDRIWLMIIIMFRTVYMKNSLCLALTTLCLVTIFSLCIISSKKVIVFWELQLEGNCELWEQVHVMFSWSKNICMTCISLSDGGYCIDCPWNIFDVVLSWGIFNCMIHLDQLSESIWWIIINNN